MTAGTHQDAAALLLALGEAEASAATRERLLDLAAWHANQADTHRLLGAEIPRIRAETCLCPGGLCADCREADLTPGDDAIAT